MSDFIAYLSLDDFINYVVPNIQEDHQIRVEAIRRNIGDNVQWIVVITSKTYGGVALLSILVGQAWKFAVRDEPWHHDNADKAARLIRRELGNSGFATAPGVWNPQAVLDNLVYGTADLWHFEDHRLVANEHTPPEEE